MRYVIYFALLVGALAWSANRVEGGPVPTTGLMTVETTEGTAYLDLDADGRAYIVTGDLAKAEKRGTFSTYNTTRRSERLEHLREVNKPAPPPPAPLVEVNVLQSTTVVERSHHHGRGPGRDGYRNRYPVLRRDNRYSDRHPER